MGQELAVLDSSPALMTGKSYGALLEDLMWVSSVDFDQTWTMDGHPVGGRLRRDYQA